MPEGDTIHRAARTLARALQDAVVSGFTTTVPQVRAARPDRLVGQTVAVVEARGKHLLVWFAPGELALHTHLGMHGSWHLYRPGQRWRRPAHRSRVAITVPDHVAVCFSAPTCELLTRRQVAAHRQLEALGPDALAPVADLAEARRRLDARPTWSIGEVLLDQRVLAGVGNVYRCEVLFLEGVNPWVPVEELPDDTRDGLLATAQRLLRANTDAASARRVTVARDAYLRPADAGLTASTSRDGGGRLAVYARAGRPCRRCGTRIRVTRSGPQARLVYWCPGCQPSPPAGSGPGTLPPEPRASR